MPSSHSPGPDRFSSSREDAGVGTTVGSLSDMVRAVTDILCPSALDVLADVATTLAAPFAVDATVASARTLIGEEVVYDQALFDSLQCDEFTHTIYEKNDAALRSGVSLDEILVSAIVPHLCKAGTPSELRERFKDLPGGLSAVDVLSHGARDCMVPDFTPNGGKQCLFGPSYEQYQPICNENLLNLAKAGRVVAFSRNVLEEKGYMKKLHISPLIRVPKADKIKGRVCLHLSKRSSTFDSVNHSVDDIKSDMLYPMRSLPLLPDLAEMACQQRALYPNEPLAGATIDISDGYHQFAQTLESAKRHATQIKIPRPGMPGAWMIVVCIYVVGVFGSKKAGNIFCTANGMVDEVHNHGHDVKRSLTYIDDTMILGPRRLIRQWLQECVDAAVSVWGKGAVNLEKLKCWEDRLIGIGWDLDLESWRAQPKDRGMAKLVVALFDVVPPGTVLVEERDMDHLKGLLQWYASGLPGGQAFLASLYACAFVDVGKGRYRYRLSTAAQRDLTWWRALMLVAYHHPHVLGVSIDAVRRVKVPTMYMRTDASTSVGGGGLVSLSAGGELLDVPDDAIRWTAEEMRVFVSQGISINTLEYYAAIYFVMLWSHLFVGQIVHLECDNTAAVSWLMKCRANAGNEAADALVKIFSLFCLRHLITITSSHLRGIDNVVADYRSRDLDHMAQGGDEDTCRGTLCKASTRKEICRRILHTCVVLPSSIDGVEIRSVLMALDSTPGSSTVQSSV